MVELLLNLVWLTIAGSGMAWHLRRGSKGHRQFFLALAALGCAVLLLFPSISVSDDLQTRAFVAEDSSPNKRLASEAAHATPWGQFGGLLFLAGFLLAGQPRILWFLGRPGNVQSLLVLFQRPVVGRSPPIPVLA